MLAKLHIFNYFMLFQLLKKLSDNKAVREVPKFVKIV
jgi:hypothetical protein